MLKVSRPVLDPGMDPATSKKRVRSSTFKASWHLPMTMAAVLLGILLALQFKTQLLLKGTGEADSTASQLSRLNKYLETERNKLTADLKEARDNLTRYEKAVGGDSTTIRLLKEELDKVRMQAGLVPVKGPGVVITLNDSLKKPKPGEDAYLYLVHDVDIQSFINELWSAGAEAVAVNDQRVVASTSVRCVGPTVLVNGSRLTPPYVIRAISDPSSLETGIKMSGGVLDSMQGQMQKGVRIEFEKKKDMVVPEFMGSIKFRYAEAVNASGHAADK